MSELLAEVLLERSFKNRFDTEIFSLARFPFQVRQAASRL
jgi:hypothetical protein